MLRTEEDTFVVRQGIRVIPNKPLITHRTVLSSSSENFFSLGSFAPRAVVGYLIRKAIWRTNCQK